MHLPLSSGHTQACQRSPDLVERHLIRCSGLFVGRLRRKRPLNRHSPSRAHGHPRPPRYFAPTSFLQPSSLRMVATRRATTDGLIGWLFAVRYPAAVVGAALDAHRKARRQIWLIADRSRSLLLLYPVDRRRQSRVRARDGVFMGAAQCRPATGVVAPASAHAGRWLGFDRTRPLACFLMRCRSRGVGMYKLPT